MRHITIAGAPKSEAQLLELLKARFSEPEQAHLTRIANEAAPGLLFLGRVMKRETFIGDDDFVSWVRTAMEGL